MKRKVTVVLLALAAALLLGLSVFFVACDVGTESGGQNTEQGGTDEEQGDGNEGETGGETGEEGGDEGEMGEEEQTPSHTHTMTYIAAEEATCTEEGNVAYWYCSGCGKNFSDEAGENELTLVTAPAKNHSFGEWVDNEDGETHTRTCSACTATETEDHAFGVWVDNENGTHTRTCSVCFATETEDHAFGAWVDNENGTHTRTCSVCSATETEDHTFGAWENNGDGTHTHTCA